MTNDKPSYTYLLFEKFWEEHKEFLKLQIKNGPLPHTQEGKPVYNSIYNRRKEYYEWLKTLKQSGLNFLNSKQSLSWDNPEIDDDLTKIKKAAWITFSLLIDKCEGSEEWGRVAEVFKVIVHLLCGNECKLQYNALSYMFFVEAYDIFLQAIYNGLSLLSKDPIIVDNKEKKSNIYNITDYSFKGSGPAPSSKEYKYHSKEIPTPSDKDKVFVKVDFTMGSINADLKNYRYSFLPEFEKRKNISNITNTLVQHRNSTIHNGYSITDDFQEKPEAYKVRLAGIIYDYITIVYYLIEYIDKVNDDYEINTSLYLDGQKELTFDKFVTPASKIIKEAVEQLEAYQNLPREEKNLSLNDQFETPKHYSILTDVDEILTKTGIPEDAKALIPAIISDPGTLESLFERLKSVQKENNETIISTFQEFIKEHRDQIEEKLNVLTISVQEGIAEVKEEIVDVKVNLKKQGEDISEIKTGIAAEQAARAAAAKAEAERIRAEAERIKRMKKWIKRDNIYIVADIIILLSMFVGCLIRDNILKSHYTQKANQELILARDCKAKSDYENVAIHDKAAFHNTLKAFQIDTTDNSLRRRLIYMYQWGKGTPEDHEKALALAAPIKDNSPQNFGRYIYLRYTTNPSDTLSIFSEIEHKRYNNTDASAQTFLQDSLVRLTNAVIGLSFADNEQDEDKHLSLIKEFDAAGMYEAKWEMAKFMLRQKKLIESGKSVHFMPTETLNKLNTLAWDLNYGEAWKELGNIYDIFELNDLTEMAYRKSILAGKDNLYLDYAVSNSKLWQEYSDTIYEQKYKTYMQKAAANGDSIARLFIDLDNGNIKFRDKALLDNKAAPYYSVAIARELLRKNPSPSTMNTLLQLFHKNGRNDVNQSYLMAHKAYYEGDIRNYINLMQQAWEDSCLMAYLCLGDYCINIKEYDNARYYYNKVKEKTLNDTVQTYAFDRLLNLALVEGDTISISTNAPNASVLWKLEVGHYKDNPEYIITECQNLLFSNQYSLNQKGLIAFLIGNAYEHLGNYSLAIDWYVLAAHTLNQTWAYGPLFALTSYIERVAALEAFKDTEGYDLSTKKEWSQEEKDMMRYIYKKVIPINMLADENSGEIHAIVPYALRQWGEEILKVKELPDKYKEALLLLARIVDKDYGTTVVNDLSNAGLNINMPVDDIDVEEAITNLTDMVSPRLLPDSHPRIVEF